MKLQNFSILLLIFIAIVLAENDKSTLTSECKSEYEKYEKCFTDIVTNTATKLNSGGEITSKEIEDFCIHLTVMIAKTLSPILP